MIFSTKQLHLLWTFPGFGETGFGKMGLNRAYDN